MARPSARCTCPGTAPKSLGRAGHQRRPQGTLALEDPHRGTRSNPAAEQATRPGGRTVDPKSMDTGEAMAAGRREWAGGVKGDSHENAGQSLGRGESPEGGGGGGRTQNTHSTTQPETEHRRTRPQASPNTSEDAQSEGNLATSGPTPPRTPNQASPNTYEIRRKGGLENHGGGPI